MRSYLLIAPILLLAACPSLDGFVSDGGMDSTSDVQADAPDGGFGGYLSLDQAALFCTKALTCPWLMISTQVSLEIPVDNQNYAACISWLAGPLPPDRIGLTQASNALGCSANATSCTAADGCMWFEFIDPNDPRCFGITSSACSSDKKSFYQCAGGSGSEFVAHCDNPVNFTGSACLTGSATFCAISSGLCSNPDAGPPPPCNGSFNTYCASSGLLAGYDCNAYGMTCGNGGCLSSGLNKPCNTFNVTCNGTTVDVCNDLLTSEFKCASMGGTCDSTGHLPRCATPTDSCSPYDSAENVCTGDAISLCIGGQPVNLDCTTIGLHCTAGVGNVSAHCE